MVVYSIIHDVTGEQDPSSGEEPTQEEKLNTPLNKTNGNPKKSYKQGKQQKK